jgi:hypothetical protein
LAQKSSLLQKWIVLWRIELTSRVTLKQTNTWTNLLFLLFQCINLLKNGWKINLKALRTILALRRLLYVSINLILHRVYYVVLFGLLARKYIIDCSFVFNFYLLKLFESELFTCIIIHLAQLYLSLNCWVPVVFYAVVCSTEKVLWNHCPFVAK